MAQLLPSYPYPSDEKLNTWAFDTIANCTIAGVPINTTTAYTDMTIDWGDGTVTPVTSVDDYVHTYEEAGQYHIIITCDNWSQVTLSYTTLSNAASPIGEARTSISKIYLMPQVANTSFNYIFYLYTALTELAQCIFDNNRQAETFAGTFGYCSNLATIPENLFLRHRLVSSFSSIFQSCSSLTNQSVYIGATQVTSARQFMYNAGSDNIVYVPADSTTYSTFSSASNRGCTVATY